MKEETINIGTVGDDLLRAYEQGLEDGKPKWISVTDRLPEKFEFVLVRSKVVKMRTDFIKDNGKWYNTPCVTHWMPLPEPPKEEKDG